MVDVSNAVKTFYSTRIDGPMSGGKAFYNENMSREEIIKDLKRRRELLGSKVGIDGTKMIVPYQNLKMHKEGHFEDITERISDILVDDPNYDLWNLDIPCDIMLVRSSLKGVVLCYPVADCPVVIVKTDDTIALAHSSAACIDRCLPMQTVEAIKSVSNNQNIQAYVGPCAGSAYVYEEYPNWAKNDNWKNFIEDTKDGYKIDLKSAVVAQLKSMGVTDIRVSNIDTITDSRFYSNYAYRHGEEDKNGRFLTGAYFCKEKAKVKTR